MRKIRMTLITAAVTAALFTISALAYNGEENHTFTEEEQFARAQFEEDTDMFGAADYA